MQWYLSVVLICISLMYKWIHKIQTHVVLGSAVFVFLLHLMYFSFLKFQNNTIQNSDGWEVPKVEALKL